MVKAQIFVGRIYCRSHRYQVVGTVEIVQNGKELAFRNFKELRAILAMPPRRQASLGNELCAGRKT